MFCTGLTKAPFHTQPTALRHVDEMGNLWFISAASSNKNDEIRQEDQVQLIFSSPFDAHFLTIFGEADIWIKIN